MEPCIKVGVFGFLQGWGLNLPDLGFQMLASRVLGMILNLLETQNIGKLLIYTY